MEENRTYYIYKHTNKINGKIYIGQTCQEDANRRWRNGKGYVNSPKFYAAIQKYGWDNFKHEIIERGSGEDWANEREIYWIAYYDTFDNDNNGYNMTPGGDNYMSTFWQNSEYREKMRKSFSQARQKSWSDKEFAKARLNELLSGLEKAWANEEWRAARIANIVGDKNPNAKAVKNIETQKIFSTIKEAAEWCGLNAVSGIGQCCNHIRKTSGRHPEDGYPLHWCYADEDITIQDLPPDRFIKGRQPVKCLNSGEIFKDSLSAAQWCGLKDGSSILKCCDGNQKTAGVDPITHQRCRWVYQGGDA